MNRLHILLTIAIFLVACGNEAEEPAPPAPVDAIEISTTAYTAPAEGGEIAIAFSASADWTVQSPGDYAYLHGVIATDGGTAGSASVRFSAFPNTSGKEQTTRFAICCGKVRADITVTHPPMDIELTPEEEIKRYLLRLYADANCADGRFPSTWREDLPLSKWGSEVHYNDGKLQLFLSEHQMRGKIDLSGCTALTKISCSKNQLTELNLSGCPLLETVDATSNDLTAINVDGCHSLQSLSAGYNPRLRDIRVAGLRKLSWFDCSECDIYDLDLSGCCSLTDLGCHANHLTRLDIPERKKLECLWCYTNRLSSLDVADSPQLHLVNCGDNALTSVNFAGCPKLSRLFCYENQLESIDLSAQRGVLWEFYCYSNKLTSLDVAGIKTLSHLHCSDNWLTELDVTGCRGLGSLWASFNRLTTLTLDSSHSLVNCDLTGNRLTSIPVEQCHYGGKLYCRDNPVLSEIPACADDLSEFEHDARYEYDEWRGTVTDNKRGWWYPGEPESGKHARL